MNAKFAISTLYEQLESVMSGCLSVVTTDPSVSRTVRLLHRQTLRRASQQAQLSEPSAGYNCKSSPCSAEGTLKTLHPVWEVTQHHGRGAQQQSVCGYASWHWLLSMAAHLFQCYPSESMSENSSALSRSFEVPIRSRDWSVVRKSRVTCVDALNCDTVQSWFWSLRFQWSEDTKIHWPLLPVSRNMFSIDSSNLCPYPWLLGAAHADHPYSLNWWPPHVCLSETW
jgi:hypothetical protein